MNFFKGLIDPNGDMSVAIGIILFVIETLTLLLIGIIGAIATGIEFAVKKIKTIRIVKKEPLSRVSEKDSRLSLF